MDPLAIARYGMMSAQQALDRSAERVVQQPAEPEPGSEAIARLEAEMQFAFSARVVAFDAAMWRALLTLQR
jgi:hypothetical protein